MPSDSQPTPPTDAAAAASHFGENRGIQFSIKTGGKRYNCTLQDRSHYERMKAMRQNSTDSTTSSSASSTTSASK
ncbi:hypothetical protein NLU13_0752 [Sarocladium strictum]|uniref:Uncharacterized protein n=1 Tax=Sarocladium strictum TaxID=5046 RepID=A0AA39GPX5_SARSR|nr:hypothetical protein NLU13_0752 [Sarocladium strictum]